MYQFRFLNEITKPVTTATTAHELMKDQKRTLQFRCLKENSNIEFTDWKNINEEQGQFSGLLLERGQAEGEPETRYFVRMIHNAGGSYSDWTTDSHHARLFADEFDVKEQKEEFDLVCRVEEHMFNCGTMPEE